jgi:predicted oxidoreductase
VLSKGAPAPVEAFKKHGADFVVADTLEELVAGMNNLTDAPLLDAAAVRAQIEARDLQMANPYSKDAQSPGHPQLAALPRRPPIAHRRAAPHPRSRSGARLSA